MKLRETEQDAVGSEEERLGRRLKEAREFLGLSQESVATAMDLPRATISAIEAGKRKVSGTELKRFAELYKRNIDFFFAESAKEDDQIAVALFRATRDLKETDREQVLRFAEFLKGAGSAPKPNNG